MQAGTSEKGKPGDFVVSQPEIIQQSNYDLVVVVVPGDNILIKLEYNTLKYDLDMIEKTMLHLNNILEQIALCGEEVSSL
jgi:hypothetical protein